MGSGDLGKLIADAINTYINTLTDTEKRAGWGNATQRENLQKAIYNEVEDWTGKTIIMTDTNLTLSDLDYGTTRIILPASGITANRTVTLPTLADNIDKEIIIENNNNTYYLAIDGEGSETINTLLLGYLIRKRQRVIIKANSSEWEIIEGSLFDKADYQTYTISSAANSTYYSMYGFCEFLSSGKIIYHIWGYQSGNSASPWNRCEYTIHRAFTDNKYLNFSSCYIATKNTGNPTSISDGVFPGGYATIMPAILGFVSSTKIDIALTRHDGNIPTNDRQIYTIKIETEL